MPRRRFRRICFKEVKEEVKEEVKGEVKEEVKEEVKGEVKEEVKGEVKLLPSWTIVIKKAGDSQNHPLFIYS